MGVSEYGSVAHLVEGPSRGTQFEQYSDTVLNINVQRELRVCFCRMTREREREIKLNRPAIHAYWVGTHSRRELMVSALAPEGLAELNAPKSLSCFGNRPPQLPAASRPRLRSQPNFRQYFGRGFSTSSGTGN